MRLYSFDRTYRKVVRLFGEPTTKYPTGSHVWNFGKSYLRLYRLASQPDRCTLSYNERPTYYAFAGDVDPRGWVNRLTIDEVIRRFAVRVGVNLFYGLSVGLAASSYVPCLWHRGEVFCDLPPGIQRLAWGVLRGEVEVEMFVDALKHDTEILG